MTNTTESLIACFDVPGPVGDDELALVRYCMLTEENKRKVNEFIAALRASQYTLEP